MTVPLGRPLRYERYPFVQAARASTHLTDPRDPLSEHVSPGRAALVPDFEASASASFEPKRVHPQLRRFYESADRHRLRIDALRWERWAEPLSFGYVPLARRLGNLCVPPIIDGGARMSSAVHHLALPDGGQSRRWVRTFAGTSRLFYVAALRTWVSERASYWSLAFPFPGFNVTVLLRLRNRGDGIELSSRDDDLAGTYAIVPGKRRFVALPGPPTHERLRFWVEGDAIAGTHEDYLGDRRTFSLRYRIEL